MFETHKCNTILLLKDKYSQANLKDTIKMNGKYRIGVDAGTSAFKAVLTDLDGNTLNTAEKQVELLRSGANVEMNANAYGDTFFALLKEVAGPYAAEVAGIAVSGAAGSTLMLDENDRPSEIICWLDGRSRQKAPECLDGLTSTRLRSITGWPCVNSFPLAHIGWWKENAPQRLVKSKWVGISTDWLLFLLSGRHAMDFSTATTMHTVDQSTMCYSSEIINKLELRPRQLSRIAPPGEAIGKITTDAARCTGINENAMIFTGAFDHPSAARGCGISKEGEMLLSCGTSWVAFMPVADRDWIIRNNLLCDPFLSHKGGPWGAMFSIAGLGQKIDNFVTKYISDDPERKYTIFNELAAKAADCTEEIDMISDNVQSLPPEKMARAIMNGCATMFASSLAKLPLQQKTRRVVLAGGPAKSSIWPGIIRERTGFDIVVTDSFTGAKGAASLAGMQ